MSLPPTLSLVLPAAAIQMNEKDNARARALIAIFGICALAAGALTGLASHDALLFVGALLVILLAAWVLPLPWPAVLIAALLPFQLYLPVPGTSFTVRVALVFVFAVALRAIADQPVSRLVVGLRKGSVVRRYSWLMPAALFLLAGIFAGFAAQDRYAAFKGVYDWLAVFVTAFVVAAQRPSHATVRRILIVLIAGGVLQALLGMLQYVLGLDAVLDLLRLPAAGLLYQPNLLQDRLSDLSFNWVTFDRALPFGTFVNGIDYAVYIAAILCLTIALVIAPEQRSASSGRRSSVVLAVGVVLIAVALLLTFKGSGALALFGGLAAIALFSLPRLSRQTVIAALLVLAGALVLAWPFTDLLGQRSLFLLQREQGLLGTTGRLAIWSSLLQFIAQQPLFGYGLNNAIALMEPQRTLRGGASAFLVATPESAYVSALVETGWVGLVSLAAWLLRAVTAGWRRAIGGGGASSIGIVAALAALLAGNLTVSGLTTDQNGMLLGVLVGLVYGMEQDERAE